MTLGQANQELSKLCSKRNLTEYEQGKIYELEQIIDYLTGANDE